MPDSVEARDPDPDSPVTFGQLETALNKVIGGTLSSIEASIERVTSIAENALALVKKLEADVSALKTGNAALKKKVDANEKDFNTRMTALEEKVEERTNRQLRKTIVIKGVPEKPKDQTPETWEESRVKIANEIAKVCTDVSEDDAYMMIERAHRSSPNPHYTGNDPRPIFAAVAFWPDTVKITDAFRAKNIEDKHHKVKVDYKYGPLTTKRRSLAMQERRKMKDNREIVSAFVAYPARLMVKRPGETKYSLAKDFSKVKVTLGRRD